MSQSNKKSPTWKVLGLLFLILVVPIIWIIINKTGVHYSKKLPIYFDRELDSKGDTIYHTIENFKLTNQENEVVTLNTYDDKIMLVNFFFASCETVCPEMNNFIAFHIYTEFEKDDMIRFLSFTVDPSNDTPSVLLDYSKKLNAKLPNWSFLTGNKTSIYNLAEYSFKIPGAADEHNGLFHSNKIVLVDKLKRVRGVFETGGENDKKEIIDAVRALKLEYSTNVNHKSI